jgi:CBS domain containing-hemolysin-like protein
MSSVAIEIVIIVLLVLFNGLLAMSELALVSARKLHLQQRADQGDAGDAFVWDSWRFEVMDMDDRRVDKVLVSPLTEQEASVG